LNFKEDKLGPSDVVEYDDELLNESYFAIYHMYEKHCEVSDEELLYLRDCLEGKYEFSRIERDNYYQRFRLVIVRNI
jgi:hypothetical protein